MSRRVERGEPTGSPSAEQGFALRLDTMSESEEQQIRFWEQAKGLRDSRRFAVGYISGFHTQQTPSRIEPAPSPSNHSQKNRLRSFFIYNPRNPFPSSRQQYHI